MVYCGQKKTLLNKHLNQSLYIESGSISITNPYELHSNPLVDNFIRISFDTLYVSADLMYYLSAGKNIQFENRKINDVALNTAFHKSQRSH